VYCDVSDRPSSSFNARVLVFSFLASPALRADTLLPESWIQPRELVLSPSTSLPSPWAWCQKWVCSFAWAKQKGRVHCGCLWRGPERVYDSACLPSWNGRRSVLRSSGLVNPLQHSAWRSCIVNACVPSARFEKLAAFEMTFLKCSCVRVGQGPGTGLFASGAALRCRSALSRPGDELRPW